LKGTKPNLSKEIFVIKESDRVSTSEDRVPFNVGIIKNALESPVSELYKSFTNDQERLNMLAQINNVSGREKALQCVGFKLNRSDARKIQGFDNRNNRFDRGNEHLTDVAYYHIGNLDQKQLEDVLKEHPQKVKLILPKFLELAQGLEGQGSNVSGVASSVNRAFGNVGGGAVMTNVNNDAEVGEKSSEVVIDKDVIVERNKSQLGSLLIQGLGQGDSLEDTIKKFSNQSRDLTNLLPEDIVSTSERYQNEQNRANELLESSLVNQLNADKIKNHQMCLAGQMENVINDTIQRAVVNVIGTSSDSKDDEKDLTNGVWVGGFLGNGVDKNTANKIKTNFAGGSIGYERFINESDILGVSVSRITSSSKAEDVKIKSQAYVLSLYTVMNFDNMLVGGYVFGGRNQSKLDDGSKPKSYLYGVNASLGYVFVNGDHLVTSVVGLSYYGSNQDDYETKDGYKVKSGNSSVLNAKAAVKYAYNIERENMRITPAMTVGVVQDLAIKSHRSSVERAAGVIDSADVRVEGGEGESFTVRSNQQRKTMLFVRPSIVMQGRGVDVGVYYSFETAKKYVGHTGSIKVLLKF
jgi:hypothetical protein